jgi:hypothetical protein
MRYQAALRPDQDRPRRPRAALPKARDLGRARREGKRRLPRVAASVRTYRRLWLRTTIPTIMTTGSSKIRICQIENATMPPLSGTDIKLRAFCKPRPAPTARAALHLRASS